jgi:ATP-binding cassette subfamily B protein
LGQTVDLFERAMASTRRILDLLATDFSIRDPQQARHLDEVRGEIRFQDLSFGYGDGPALFQDLNLTIPAKQMVALVGGTGSGKTSLIKLLLRFYDPTAGKVLLDGIDLRELSLKDLRHHIGLVSQDVFLFQGTIHENIAYGVADADLDQVREAARLSEAAEFIEALPEQYDTLVGERGQKLSGGQRQRISIARVILKRPPILVFDEATSAVDNETELAIQKSLARIARDRTTVVIAHRLSTIRGADIIHVLDRGSIVESGRHDDLVAQAGLYANLWRIQSGQAIST